MEIARIVITAVLPNPLNTVCGVTSPVRPITVNANKPVKSGRIRP